MLLKLLVVTGTNKFQATFSMEHQLKKAPASDQGKERAFFVPVILQKKMVYSKNVAKIGTRFTSNMIYYTTAWS